MSRLPDFERCNPKAAGLDPLRLERITQALQQRIDEGRLPGSQVVIVRHGALGCFESLGRLDPSRDTPMPADAIFRIYSMTKPIVAVATMMLVEQGRLSLSHPVSRFVPEFADVRVGEAQEAPRQPMTVHDLLRHTAGLSYEFFVPEPLRKRYAEANLGARERSNAEFARTLAALPLAYQPGSIFDYSRATDLLGRVVEVVSGQTLGEHLRQTVLEPLGMRDTGFHVPAERHHRIAEPFAHDPDSGEPVSVLDVRRPYPFEGGGGALVSTAIDYARFLQMMLDEGALDDVRLLGRKTVQWMVSDHLGDLPRTANIAFPGYGMGLGFAVRTHAGMATLAGSVGDYGWSGAAGTHFFVDPAERLFALLMVQAPGLHDELGGLFRNLVYAALDG
ncbi:serine hydrolase domain-containing protein [Piscinibacter sp. XHJ-5]|uniref:serine hydrolase domain-containing protein n=1 Tax=Piscinibacter sp. XHJ-5 TaxID=3037797 RepID=UPI002452D6D6|nr:serine hydrolase domain-containing protein [Piscinibacter sp. XHJ-5]